MNISCNSTSAPTRHIQQSRIPTKRNKEDETSPLEALLLEHRKTWRPLLYHLLEVEWSIFGTLTWSDPMKRRDTHKAQWFREEDFSRLLQLTRLQMGLRSRSFNFYHATERGAAWECHFHFLFTRRGLEKVAPSVLAETMTAIWGGEIPGAGTSEIRPFDEARQFAGVAYCLKREYDENRGEREPHDRISDGLMGQLRYFHKNRERAEKVENALLDTL